MEECWKQTESEVNIQNASIPDMNSGQDVNMSNVTPNQNEKSVSQCSAENRQDDLYPPDLEEIIQNINKLKLYREDRITRREDHGIRG